METILAFLTSKAGLWMLGILGVGSVSMILDKLLRKYITDARLATVHDGIVAFIAAPGGWLGLAFSKAGTQLPVLGKMWNKSLEPWVIVFLETVGTGVTDGIAELFRRIMKAMQSDNPSTRV